MEGIHWSKGHIIVTDKLKEKMKDDHHLPLLLLCIEHFNDDVDRLRSITCGDM